MEHMMEPYYVAVLVAAIASFIFGWIWYGPIFGKMVMKSGDGAKSKASSYILTFIGILLTAYVMGHFILWHATINMMEHSAYAYAFWAALYVWIGFFVPMCLGKVSWEGKSWNDFFVHAVYNFVNLQIIAAVLTYMH